jgi:hypothetical protein
MRAAPVLLFTYVALVATPARAGVYLSPSLRWSSFALRPAADEATPNYYGVGASAAGGYSVAQVFDLGGFYTYVPARLKSASLAGKDATLDSYGADVAFRIADSVYLDFRGGAARYHLIHQTRPEELPGRWHGPAGAVALGAVARLGKQSFFQTSLELLHTVLENQDVPGKRRLDAFALSFAYVYNAEHKFRFEDTIYRDFLDGLSFF